MSQRDYLQATDIAYAGVPLTTLIMAAMLSADTDNLSRLRLAWPAVWQEVEDRSHQTDGALATDADI